MERYEFIRTCGLGCLGLLAGATMLESCSGTRYVTAPINGSFLEVPAHAFRQNEEQAYLSYVVVENEKLQYPISVFRLDDANYRALYMKCTHQGTELQVFGDRLQCPAHGSEFTNTGKVQNGPADGNLRTFPVTVLDDKIKIDLS